MCLLFIALHNALACLSLFLIVIEATLAHLGPKAKWSPYVYVGINRRELGYIPSLKYNQFDRCGNLTTVDLVGAEGIHKTISSLLLESWRNEMNQEIDRINQDLPNTPPDEKTAAIQHWIRSVLNRMEYYKAEHNRLVLLYAHRLGLLECVLVSLTLFLIALVVLSYVN
jgi:hypothetical protein